MPIESILKRQFCVCLFILISFIPVTADCSELIGVLPISNQRAHNQIGWLEYYIQARIESNLRNNSNWQFHSNDVIHLWKHRTDLTQPISSESTILISGVFQIVLRFGYLRIQVERYHLSSTLVEEFEKTFIEEELDDALDNISLQIGKWIQPEFELQNRITDLVYEMSEVRQIYSYRSLLYQEGLQLDIQRTLAMKELINENSPADWIGDLSQGLIILSQFLAGKDGLFLLDQSKMILQKAILKNKKHARLYALLAETYYFKEDPRSWVEKTALEAVDLDSSSDLGRLLIALIMPSEPEGVDSTRSRLKTVNPWFWKDQKFGAILFQKGIFKDELLKMVDLH